MDLIHRRALVLLLTLKGPAIGPQDHPWRKEPYLFGCQTVKLISSLRHALSKATYSKLGYQGAGRGLGSSRTTGRLPGLRVSFPPGKRCMHWYLAKGDDPMVVEKVKTKKKIKNHGSSLKVIPWLWSESDALIIRLIAN